MADMPLDTAPSEEDNDEQALGTTATPAPVDTPGPAHVAPPPAAKPAAPVPANENEDPWKGYFTGHADPADPWGNYFQQQSAPSLLSANPLNPVPDQRTVQSYKNVGNAFIEGLGDAWTGSQVVTPGLYGLTREGADDLAKWASYPDVKKGQETALQSFNEAFTFPAIKHVAEMAALNARMFGSVAQVPFQAIAAPIGGGIAAVKQVLEEAGQPLAARDVGEMLQLEAQGMGVHTPHIHAPEEVPERPIAEHPAVTAFRQPIEGTEPAPAPATPAGPALITPDFIQAAKAQGIIGTQAEWDGTSIYAAARDQPLPPIPDIDGTARGIAPEAFQRNDELLTQRDALRSWINTQSNPPDAAFEDLAGKRYLAEEALRNANPNSPAARSFRAEIADVANQEQELTTRREAWENGTHVDTPDIMLARQHLMDTEHALWDLGPEISAARRQATEQAAGAPDEVPSVAAEQAPPESTPAIEQPAAEPPKSPEAQRAFITADRAAQLIAAGRPAPIAHAEAAVEAAYYTTLSQRFGGALGSPEDLYRARAARVVGPDGEAAPIARAEPTPAPIRTIADIQADEKVSANKAREIQASEPAAPPPAETPRPRLRNNVEIGGALGLPEPDLQALAIGQKLTPAKERRVAEEQAKDWQALAEWQAAHRSAEPRTRRNPAQDRIAASVGISPREAPPAEIFADIVDRLPEERVVEEIDAEAEAGQIEYHDAERDAAEIDPKVTEDPDTFYDADQSRSLEELEREREPQNETALAQQRAGGGGEPEPAATGEGQVSEGGGPPGRVVGAGGRAEPEAGVVTGAVESAPGGAASEPAGVAARPAVVDPYTTVPKPPRTLSQFLRQDYTVGEPGTVHQRTVHGGLRDDGGDLAAIIGATKNHPVLRGGRGIRGLINNETGQHLDAATQRAWDAGYFPEHDQRPSINELLDKIDEDINRGNPQYSHQDQNAVEAHNDAMARNSEIDNLASKHGIPTRGLTHDQFFDALADKLSLDDLAEEHARLEEDHGALRDDFEAATKDWVAHHGTPHDFDQFDTSKIGSGEGAQAYGHGLYFAENEGVASSYRDQLSASNPIRQWYEVDGKRIRKHWSDSSPEAVAAHMLYVGGNDKAKTVADIKRIIGLSEKKAREVNDYSDVENWRETLKQVQSFKGAVRLAQDQPGHLYTVRIKAKPEEMLDWDKPLSEQSEHVKTAIKEIARSLWPADQTYVHTIGADGKVKYLSRPDIDNMTGGELIDAAKSNGIESAEFSDRLRDAGIKGIRYLDRSSRDLTVERIPEPLHDAGKWQVYKLDRDGGSEPVGEPHETEADAHEAAGVTHNIVIFNHDDVEITHKNGEPVTPHAPTQEEIADLDHRAPSDLDVGAFYGNDQSRTLEDLEHEYRQEIAATGSRERGGGTAEPGTAGRPAGEGEAAQGLSGNSDRIGGRDETQDGARDLLGQLIPEPAGRRASEPTVRNDERQTLIPGTEPSARQAQAARDAAGPREGQERANEGLFAPKDVPESDLLQRVKSTIQGRIRISSDPAIRSIVTVARSGDASTFMHETAHDWLKQLLQDAGHELAPADLKADAATVRKWLQRPANWTGFDRDGRPDTAPQERFARSFEQYLREGHAPSRALDGVFAKFKGWLTTIYRTLRGLGAPISDDIRGVFDRMLAIEPRENTYGEVPDRQPSLADIHESDAEETPPHEAEAARDRVVAERDRNLTETHPELGNAPEAGTPPEPVGEAGTGPGGGGVVDQGSREPEPVAGAGQGGPGRGAVEPGSGAAMPQGAAAPGRPGVAEKPQPLPPSEPSGPLAELKARRRAEIPKIANVRLEYIDEERWDDLAREVAGQLELSGDPRVTAGSIKAVTLHAINNAALDGWDKAKTAWLAGPTPDNLMEMERAKGRAAAAFENLSAGLTDWGKTGNQWQKIIKESKRRVAEIAAGSRDDMTLFQRRAEIELLDAMDNPDQVGKALSADYLTKWDKFNKGLMAYYLSNILSGIVTHLGYLNGGVVGNVVHGLITIPAQAGYGAARTAMNDGTVPRVLFGEVPAHFYGLANGVMKGVAPAIRALKTGEVTMEGVGRAAAPYEQQILPTLLGGKVGYILETPLRAIRAIHVLNYSMRFTAEISRLAYRSAMEAFGPGATPTQTEFGMAIQRYMNDIPPEDMSYAHDEAIRSVLMKRPAPGSSQALVATALDRLPVLRYFAPFPQIGMNLAEEGLVRNTPLGLFNKNVRQGLAAGGAAQDIAVGRMMAGTGIAAGIVALTLNGMVTGPGPDENTEQGRDRARVLKAQGWAPYSFRWGDTYIPLRKGLGPLGELIGMSATLAETYRAADEGQYEEAGARLAHGFAESVADETWLRGIHDAFDAFTHADEKLNYYLTNMATNFIPLSQFNSQMARQIDPDMRAARGFIETAQSKLPFLSEQLHPQIGPWGDPVLSHSSMGPHTYTDDPVGQRLIDLGMGVPGFSRNIKGVPMDEAQYEQYGRLAGTLAHQLLMPLVTAPGFSAIPAGMQMKQIQARIAEAREKAETVVQASDPVKFYGGAAALKQNMLMSGRPVAHY